jgi:uncharacterized protein DUF3551
MRSVFLALLATSAFTLGALVPANAVGVRHAFCLQGDEYPGLSNCTYDTYAQCAASASGRFLTCVANPYFAGQTGDPYARQNRSRPWPPGYQSYPPRW